MWLSGKQLARNEFPSGSGDSILPSAKLERWVERNLTYIMWHNCLNQKSTILKGLSRS